MLYGHWGKMIEIDMTTGKVEITDRHVQYLDEYIGGNPLASKLLWEALKDKPDCDPFGPDNVFMFMPGITSGTPIPGAASRYLVCTKSGLTKAKNPLYGDNSATVGFAAGGGKFASYLKMAGYDLIYIYGVSSTPKYLHINNDTVELLDATEYWGMTIPEYEEAMQARHGYDHTVVSIGPAGEKKLGYSSVICEGGRAAARGGCAPVLGAKMFKGVCVYGNKSIPVADPKGWKNLVYEMDNAIYSWSDFQGKREYGSTNTLTTNYLQGGQSVRNHIGGCNPYEDATSTVAVNTNFFVHHRSCYACPVRCMKMGVVNEGPYKGDIAEGPEYEHEMVIANWLLDDLGKVGRACRLVDELGIDCIGGGGLVAFAMEAYENGVITSDMIDGIKLEWGNMVEIEKFLYKLCGDAEGELWDWLRCGSSYTAWHLDAKYGTNTARYAMDVKNSSFAAHAISMWYGYVFPYAYSFSTRGACHTNGTSYAALCAQKTTNMGIFCNRSGSGIYGVAGLAKILSFMTGKEYTVEQLTLIGERCYQMEKVFNVCQGFVYADDDLPRRVFEDNVLWGPVAGKPQLDEKSWAGMRTAFYEQAGWNPETSIPTEGKLMELGLDDMISYMNDAVKKINAL